MSLEYAKKLRTNSTKAEQPLWYYLRAKRFKDKKFKRQQPIGPYIVDFVCFSDRLIIEVDGGQHAVNKASDTNRTKWLERAGYRVFRFWNNEALGNPEAVLEKTGENVSEK